MKVLDPAHGWSPLCRGVVVVTPPAARLRAGGSGPEDVGQVYAAPGRQGSPGFRLNRRRAVPRTGYPDRTSARRGATLDARRGSAARNAGGCATARSSTIQAI